MVDQPEPHGDRKYIDPKAAPQEGGAKDIEQTHNSLGLQEKIIGFMSSLIGRLADNVDVSNIPEDELLAFLKSIEEIFIKAGIDGSEFEQNPNRNFELQRTLRRLSIALQVREKTSEDTNKRVQNMMKRARKQIKGINAKYRLDQDEL